jgi:hypothetical protein
MGVSASRVTQFQAAKKAQRAAGTQGGHPRGTSLGNRSLGSWQMSLSMLPRCIRCRVPGLSYEPLGVGLHISLGKNLVKS